MPNTLLVISNTVTNMIKIIAIRTARYIWKKKKNQSNYLRYKWQRSLLNDICGNSLVAQRLGLFFHCRKPCSTAKETKQKKKQWNFLIANEISLLAQIYGGQIAHLMCEVTNIRDFFLLISSMQKWQFTTCTNITLSSITW